MDFVAKRSLPTLHVSFMDNHIKAQTVFFSSRSPPTNHIKIMIYMYSVIHWLCYESTNFWLIVYPGLVNVTFQHLHVCCALPCLKYFNYVVSHIIAKCCLFLQHYTLAPATEYPYVDKATTCKQDLL